MSWAGDFPLLAGYILLGRLLVASRLPGRQVMFALLNLAIVYWFYFRNGIPGYSWLFVALLAAYVVLASIQYLALCRWNRHPDRTPWLAFGLPIAFLVVFRYLPLGEIAGRFSPTVQSVFQRHPEFVLSSLFVGISYLAFRTSFLVLEVRNGVVRRPGYWEYLGFAFFAPTFAVGPISPYSMHAEAFAATGSPSIPVGRAALRVLVGAVKFKYLGPLLNQLTYTGLLLDGHPHHWTDLPVAAVAYYVFLYCNFSGFCDIAIGGAGLMGVPVAENFSNPFGARNMREFWNRWHITLSQYMRDVVFSPLSKSLVRRFGPANANHAIAVTILVVFLLVGIWHGVGWNYAAFGGLQAIGVAATHYYTLGLKARLGRERFIAYNRNRLIKAVAISVTFAYYAASLFLFANDGDAMRNIFSMIQWH